MPDPSRNILRTAPVTSLTTIESLVGAVLTFLATHHVFGDIDVSATTQTVAPFVALLLPAVFGAAKWRLVTPAIKVAELAERDGLVTDADLARISAILDDKLAEWGIEDDPAVETGDEDDAEYPDDSADDTAHPDDLTADTEDPDAGAQAEPEHRPEHEAFTAPGGMSSGGG